MVPCPTKGFAIKSWRNVTRSVYDVGYSAKKPLPSMLFYALLEASKHLIAKHNKSNTLRSPSRKPRKALHMSSNINQIQVKNFGQILLQTINNAKTHCQTSDFPLSELIIVVVATHRAKMRMLRA